MKVNAEHKVFEVR